ncbi:hypothetical protein K438DRAFT_2008994, partial [Mycena galopus ATCC 62051]
MALEPGLLHLPAELLLVVIHLLRAADSVPSEKQCDQEKIAFSSCHLRSLLLVCKHLRRLCISPLFSSLKVTHTRRLRLLKGKCAAEPEFARFIRKLDLAYVHSPREYPYRYGPDILPAFLPCLESLEWLELDAEQIDANLLAALNSHSTLITVAIRDRDLDTLRILSLSTSMSLSKIRVHAVSLNHSFGLRCLRSLMGRGSRVAHLIVRDRDMRLGPGDLLVPGLETLDIGVYREPAFLLSWLPDFVGRHGNLQILKFSGHDSAWTQNPDIVFPSRFLGAMERESLVGTVDLISFSISRTSSCSLDDWLVVHLELEITKTAGVSALPIASSMAPGVSKLMVRIPRRGPPVHIDDLISSLCCFQSLRRLELHGLSGYLLFEGGSPWTLPPPDPHVLPTSTCVIAHAALRWLAAYLAQRVSSLDLVHITDEDYDFLESRVCSWRLQMTYRVQQNREIEIYGAPKFVVGHRFRKFKPLRSPTDPPFQPAPARTASTLLLPLPSKHTAK